MNMKELIGILKNLKVLFVEDNEDTLEEFGKILHKIFTNVDFAKNGEEGLKLFKEKNHDLIISDINMPKINGIEMIRMIKNLKEDVYVVFITAFNEVEYFLEAIKLGVDGFILKPIELEQLINVFIKIAKNYSNKRQAKKYFSLLIQYQEIVESNSLVCRINKEGKILYINDVFEKILLFKNEELLGKDYRELLKDFDEKTRQDIINTVKENKIWKGIVKIINKENKIKYIDVSVKAIFENEEFLEYFIIGYDVTEIMKPRKFLLDYLNQYSGAVLSLVKIDNFENIRKLFEESFVDEIEEKFKNLLDNFKPEEAEEIFSLENGIFAVVCNGEKDKFEEYVEKWKKAQKKINDSFLEINGLKFDLYVLISIAKGKDAFENARYGIEIIKEEKNDFIIANHLVEKMKKKAKNNLKILHILKESLQNKEIVCAFQPIVNNNTLDVEKYEALVRIKKESTLIPPGEFLELAKQGNFYTQITKIVINYTIDKIKYLKNLSINISHIDILKENVRKYILNIVKNNKEIANRITIELLEDEEMEKYPSLDYFIDELKTYGVSIAIDDFGSGYSNFYRLQKYRPDFLKIDGSLIKNIVNDKYSQSIVKSIVEFARDNNIKTVAEFVENKEIFEKVKELGIDYSQGYYFGKPVLLD
ncbi:EAL domain-containing protein [Caminibacter sp.]